jgi:outer membrane lipoprotein-sorting protein
MPSPSAPTASGQIYLKFVPMRIRNPKHALAALCISLAPALTGCLTHTYTVPKTRPADVILSSTLDQLVQQLDSRYNEIQTMTANVEIEATTGGGRKGQATDSPSFSGYIFMRRPDDLRVLLKLPVLGSKALDMVTDGKTFKLIIPPRNKAIVGSNTVTTASKNGLENLRPSVFSDSLFVRGVLPDEILSLTSDYRVLENPKKKKDLVEEPDYDIEFLSQPQGQIAHIRRVVHIGRGNLLPYQQDIYDEKGQVVTRAFYSEYQKFGDIAFPTHIIIRRPQDELSLSVIITKLTFNQKMDDDQFELVIPPGVPVQKLD